MRNLLSFHKKPKWKPWANTIAYYKLEEDLNDYSWNNRNLSMYTGSFTYETLTSWKKICRFNTSAQTTNYTMPFNRTAYTVSCWASWDTITTAYQKIIFDFQSWSNYFPRAYDFNYWWHQYVSSIVSFDAGQVSYVQNKWYHMVSVFDNNTASMYIDGQLIASVTYSSSETSGTLSVNWEWNYRSGYRTWWALSELIFENKTRTATEVADYYNQTKADYEPKPRQPWANTLLYMPLDWNTTDYSWNSNNWTWTGTSQYNNILSWWTTKCAYFNSGSAINLTSEVISWNPTYSCSCWIKTSSSWQWCLHHFWRDSYGERAKLLMFYAGNQRPLQDAYMIDIYVWDATTSSLWNTWIYVVYTYTWWVHKCYINGTLYGTGSWNLNITSWYRKSIWSTDTNHYWYSLSNIIIENKVRTAQEISDYYNLTKSNYWL